MYYSIIMFKYRVRYMYLKSVLSVGKTESDQKINVAVLLITPGTYSRKVITDSLLCIGYNDQK